MITKINKKSNSSIVLVFIFFLILVAMIYGISWVNSSLPVIVLENKWLSGLNQIFSMESTQIWWFVTRSAGIIAYLLLWFSTIWGLAIPSKIISPTLEQSYTFDFHEFLSLLSIVFIFLHITVLLVDRYLPYTIFQLLIPFISPYRPFWVGIGIISFYLILLVTFTFYLRSRIGTAAFRVIHLSSFLGYFGATLHGLYAGTDSPLPVMQILYKGSALVVVFLTIYYVFTHLMHKASVKKSKIPHRLQKHRHI
jgi:predicted ferric reductase